MAGTAEWTFIGKGTFGEVHKVVDRKSAVKEVARKVFVNPDNKLTMSEHEFEMAFLVKPSASMDSIVRVLCKGILQSGTHGYPNGSPYIDFEYLAGKTLDAVLHSDQTFMEVVSTEGRLFDMLFGLLSAVAFIHKQGVLHLDIKPGNIMYVQRKSEVKDRVVLIDFGISLKTTSGDLQAHKGSIGFQPLEWWRDQLPDEKYDIFSLGATFYHVLYGSSAVQRDHIVDAHEERRGSPA